MNKVARVLFLVFLMHANTILSQKRIIEYFDENERKVSKEEAFYYRQISYDEKGEPKGLVKDYYMNGMPRWRGRLWRQDTTWRSWHEHGKCTWYYQNGTKKRSADFTKGNCNGGMHKEWYENGNLRYKGHKKNTSMGCSEHGKWEWYSSSGKIERRFFYKNGDLEGKSIHWYPDGKKMWEENFEKDEVKGFSIYYDEKGEKKYLLKARRFVLFKDTAFSMFDSIVGVVQRGEEIGLGYEECYNTSCTFHLKSYHSLSFKNGVNRTYHPNGKIKDEFHVRNRKLDGFYRGYDSTGKILVSGAYRKNLYDSTWQHSLPDDRFSYFSQYKKGKDHGLHIVYIEDSLVAYYAEFKNGRPHGKMIRIDGAIDGEPKFYKQQILLEETYYKGRPGPFTYWKMDSTWTKKLWIKMKGFENRRRHEFTSFYGNGNVEMIFTLKGKKLTVIQWYENGQKKAESYEINRKEEGPQREYDPEGKLVLEKIYKKGIWISEKKFP